MKKSHKALRIVSRSKMAFATCGLAVIFLASVIIQVDHHPRTDDATVRANLIAFAAQVEGEIEDLRVRDNQLVHKGDLLFVIDPRPYQFALQEAIASQATLEGQIHDQERRIETQKSAVDVSKADVENSHSSVQESSAAWNAAEAATTRAEALLATETSRAKLAEDDYGRIAPLLAKHFVTTQQVDEARTAVEVTERSEAAAKAQLMESKARERVALLAIDSAKASRSSAEARLGQSRHGVDTLETLKAQRLIRQSAVDRAKLNLEWCYVRAPFDGFVVNMNIALGAYAHIGSSMFTLVDTETWWVVASYRESKLKHIRPGMHVDVYLMERPEEKFDGVVESIGTGVFPEDGSVSFGLPDVERTLNWVHLSARFPVRIKVLRPNPDLFRIGATAVTVIR